MNRDNSPAIAVGFAHDIEDGWYWIEPPDDEPYFEFNHWKSVLDYCKRKGYRRVWIGNQQYNPERLKL